MSIADIRKEHGVPAKAGMTVVVKVGDHCGQRAVILGEDKDIKGHLKIRDATGRRHIVWWRRIHPTHLEYLA